jgi:hypothetical protein
MTTDKGNKGISVPHEIFKPVFFSGVEVDAELTSTIQDRQRALLLKAMQSDASIMSVMSVNMPVKEHKFDVFIHKILDEIFLQNAFKRVDFSGFNVKAENVISTKFGSEFSILFIESRFASGFDPDVIFELEREGVLYSLCIVFSDRHDRLDKVKLSRRYLKDRPEGIAEILGNFYEHLSDKDDNLDATQAMVFWTQQSGILACEQVYELFANNELDGAILEEPEITFRKNNSGFKQGEIYTLEHFSIVILNYVAFDFSNPIKGESHFTVFIEAKVKTDRGISTNMIFRFRVPNTPEVVSKITKLKNKFESN